MINIPNYYAVLIRKRFIQATLLLLHGTFSLHFEWQLQPLTSTTNRSPAFGVLYSNGENTLLTGPRWYYERWWTRAGWYRVVGQCCDADRVLRVTDKRWYRRTCNTCTRHDVNDVTRRQYDFEEWALWNFGRVWPIYIQLHARVTWRNPCYVGRRQRFCATTKKYFIT
jgi:hypothetical protein